MIQPEHIFIFTGPTLAPDEAGRQLHAVYLPPVKLGDIYRICTLFSPRIIAIVDGYFNQVPAVWHKEILYAMSQGIQVFGAASMGALRAAELDDLGMRGCGRIYDAYRNGVLPPYTDEAFEDDDEVAVIHGPPELGYMAASDAMVNIRVSLADAVQQSIIDEPLCRQLVQIAKALFYPQRNYAKVLDIARQQGAPESSLQSLGNWLKTAAIDQKQHDARTLLEQLKACASSRPDTAAKKPEPFEHTSQWQSAIDEFNHDYGSPQPALNELRLKGPVYFDMLEQTLAQEPGQSPKSLGSETGTHGRPSPLDLTPLHAAPEQLRQRLAECWLLKQAISTDPPLPDMHQDQRLQIHLQQTGALSALQHRARQKQHALEQLQQKPHINTLSGLDRLQLCDWYFSKQLGTQMPDQPHEYAAEMGFDDAEPFYAMLLDEYLYLQSRQKNQNQGDVTN